MVTAVVAMMDTAVSSGGSGSNGYGSGGNNGYGSNGSGSGSASYGSGSGSSDDGYCIILSHSDNDSHMLAQFLLVPCVATLCVWQYGHTLPYAPCAAYIWFFLPQPCFVSPMCGWGLR